MFQDPYPVIEERPLTALARRFLRPTRRDLADLPEVRPGTLWAFDTGGHYETVDRRNFSGTEPTVVDAVAVSLVDIRPRWVPVEISIPSASPADDFVFRVAFRCVVTDPSTVAAAGLTDITTPLHNYLTKDWKLLVLGRKFNVDDIAILHKEITARVLSYCEVDPPRIDGIEVTLGRITVRTPADLRTQATKIRDERWDQELRELQRVGEQADVEYLTPLLRDPQQALALAVSRGDATVWQAAERTFLELDERRKNLYEIIKDLQKDGHFDCIPVDAKFAIDSYFGTIAGFPQDRLGTAGDGGSDDARSVPDDDEPAE